MKDEVLKKIQILQDEFANKIPKKISEIEQAWLTISKQFDSKAWSDFHRLVHSFTGSSGTYGYADLSKKTRDLEIYLKQLLDVKFLSESQKKDIENLISVIENASQVRINKVIAHAHSEKKNTLKVTAINLDESLTKKIRSEFINYKYIFESIKSVDYEKTLRELKTDFLIINLGNIKENALSLIRNYKKSYGLILIVIGNSESLQERLFSVRLGADLFLDKTNDAVEVVDLVLQHSVFQEERKFRILVLDDTKSLAEYYGILIQDAG